MPGRGALLDVAPNLHVKGGCMFGNVSAGTFMAAAISAHNFALPVTRTLYFSLLGKTVGLGRSPNYGVFPADGRDALRVQCEPKNELYGSGLIRDDGSGN